MKRVITVALSCAVVASLGANGAFAGPKGNGNGAPSAKKLAAQQCKAQKQAMGNKAFKALYGKRAGAACIKKQNGQTNWVAKNAAHECKMEAADPTFPDSHGGMTFAEFYGTNHHDRNAHGKCVSSKVRAAQAEIRNNLLNAARACRAERNDLNFASEHGGKTFAEFYGTNWNNKNAFGKCVKSKAKALQNGNTT